MLKNFFKLLILIICSSFSTFSLSDAEVSKDEFIDKIEGTYAQFDVVAYSERVFPLGEFKTLIVTYGIVQLEKKEGELYATNRFCHSEHKSNQIFKSTVPDSFTRAIVPKITKMTIEKDINDEWTIYRPETPTFIGIRISDPNEPLPKNPKDPRISDDDNDGNPGVTVYLKIFGKEEELYIARREIFAYTLNLVEDGVLEGIVNDRSEQLIVGATKFFLKSQRSPDQYEDLSKSPIKLIAFSEDYDCDSLMERRHEIFPPSPEVW